MSMAHKPGDWNYGKRLVLRTVVFAVFAIIVYVTVFFILPLIWAVYIR